VFLALSDQKFLIQTYGNTPDYTVREISGLNLVALRTAKKLNAVSCVFITTLIKINCLLGIAVQCATARLSTWPGLISCTGPGSNLGQGAKSGQAGMQ